MQMEKKPIRLKVQGGLEFNDFVKSALHPVNDLFDFIRSDTPDFIVFGPYGDEVPAAGNYIRIGYFCECMYPDTSLCDWSFGVLYEKEVPSHQYKRIEWHGLRPLQLFNKPKALFENYREKKFCNFIFSNCVSYRENFFKLLSRYKRIDAPGKSMNNMASFDAAFPGLSFWERKRKFLSGYKFTIAFENYSHPGYNTEKLTDPMLAGSIPIYLGNPEIGLHFNTKSFINTHDHLKVESVETTEQRKKFLQTFEERRFYTFRSPVNKIERRYYPFLRNQRMKRLFNTKALSKIVDMVIAVDENDVLYEKYLHQPWLYEENVKGMQDMRAQWIKIFNSVK